MIEGLGLAIALAMDAFAVALTQGAKYRPSAAESLKIACFFGAAQGIMPLIGWGLGAAAFVYIAAIDHWVAFALLGFLGARMIVTGGHHDAAGPLTGMTLLAASIATSIDALAAGITLPMMGIPPLPVVGLIAAVTLVLSAAGLAIGRIGGDRFGRPAEIAGGVILIALGFKILLDHTGQI